MPLSEKQKRLEHKMTTGLRHLNRRWNLHVAKSYPIPMEGTAKRLQRRKMMPMKKPLTMNRRMKKTLMTNPRRSLAYVVNDRK